MKKSAKRPVKSTTTPNLVGKLVTIRTATVYDRGVVVSCDSYGITLKDAVFVGDTGDFFAYCASPNPRGTSEYPMGMVTPVIPHGAICDILIHA